MSTPRDEVMGQALQKVSDCMDALAAIQTSARIMLVELGAVADLLVALADEKE